jgi:hypothetical protein
MHRRQRLKLDALLRSFFTSHLVDSRALAIVLELRRLKIGAQEGWTG